MDEENKHRRFNYAVFAAGVVTALMLSFFLGPFIREVDAREKQDQWVQQCQEAGGMELITSQGRYCMRKDLFIEPDKLSK